MVFGFGGSGAQQQSYGPTVGAGVGSAQLEDATAEVSRLPFSPFLPCNAHASFFRTARYDHRRLQQVGVVVSSKVHRYALHGTRPQQGRECMHRPVSMGEQRGHRGVAGTGDGQVYAFELLLLSMTSDL